MWFVAPRDRPIRICFLVPSRPTVRKYHDLRYIGDVEPTKVEEGVYCVVERLEDTGHYAYIARTSDGGYDVVNLHVVDPSSPPETISTYVMVTHEEGSPPESALLVGPEDEEAVNVSRLEAEVSYVGPITLSFDLYWLKVIWSDGMELVVPMIPFVVAVRGVEVPAREVKRVYMWAMLQLVLGERRILPVVGTLG